MARVVEGGHDDRDVAQIGPGQPQQAGGIGGEGMLGLDRRHPALPRGEGGAGLRARRARHPASSRLPSPRHRPSAPTGRRRAGAADPGCRRCPRRRPRRDPPASASSTAAGNGSSREVSSSVSAAARKSPTSSPPGRRNGSGRSPPPHPSPRRDRSPRPDRWRRPTSDAPAARAAVPWGRPWRSPCGTRAGTPGGTGRTPCAGPIAEPDREDRVIGYAESRADPAAGGVGDRNGPVAALPQHGGSRRRKTGLRDEAVAYAGGGEHDAGGGGGPAPGTLHHFAFAQQARQLVYISRVARCRSPPGGCRSGRRWRC